MSYNRILLYVSTNRNNLKKINFYISSVIYYVLFGFAIYFSLINESDIIKLYCFLVIGLSLIRYLFYLHIYIQQIPAEIYNNIHKKKRILIFLLDVCLTLCFAIILNIKNNEVLILSITLLPFFDVITKIHTYNEISRRLNDDDISDVNKCIKNLILFHSNPYKNIKFDKISKLLSNENLENDCTICLSLLEPNNDGAKIDCNHIYHSKCLIEWLFKKMECPMCRKTVELNREIHEVTQYQTIINQSHNENINNNIYVVEGMPV